MLAKPCLQDLSVSPTYTASHSSHLILYIGPTTLSLLTRSFGFTNNCCSAFVGLKYVGMPYFPKTCFICSENPFTYGITTGISLISLSLMFPPLFLNHCYFLLLSPSKSILGSHCISMLLLDGQVLSSCPPFCSITTVFGLCANVFTTPILCSRGGYSGC